MSTSAKRKLEKVLGAEEVPVMESTSENGHPQHPVGVSNGHRGLEGPTNKTNWLTTKQLKKMSEEEGKSRVGHGGSADNGFAAWGGYMEAKKAKLDAQFNRNKENKIINGTAAPGIFNGLAVYINGYVVPPEEELRRMFVAHGGTFHPYRSLRTNYVIATNLSTSSKRLYGSITLKPEWITDSIAAGTLLNYRDYLLYDLNEENKQHTLTQMMGFDRGNKKETNAASTVTSYNGSSPVAFDEGSKTSAGLVTFDNQLEKPCSNSSVPSPSSSQGDSDSRIPEENADTPHSKDEPAVPQELGKTTSPGNSSKRVKMATEEGFLEDFFQHSRLHLISDQKKEMQNKIGNMRKHMTDHKFDYCDELKQDFNENGYLSAEDVERTLMHIDLDCFFVSVGLLSRPHLRGKPAVVTHSSGKGPNSHSDIASASYEARKYGVRNGMWVSEAKKLCPELEVIPYDFDEYRRISDKFFDTVSRFTLDIEPSSVDEMVVDATSVLRALSGCCPERLAEAIRNKIYANLGCTASIGIGSNKLLAKLATKKAKPNGIFHLKDDEAANFIKGLEIREIPGVGWSHESKLQQIFGAKYCKDLLEISETRLKAEFGAKTAEKMLQSCRGIDTSEMKYGFEKPKSVSVDVNYGIRFSTDDELKDFLLKLCKELSSRAAKAQAKGMTLVFKVLCRKKGAGDPKKHGGHGVVDAITRSTKFFKPTSDWGEMYRTVTRMFRILSIPPADYRGIGFSLSDLVFDFDQQTGSKQPVQKTLFDMASSRGKQMLEQAMKANRKREASSADNSLSNSTSSTDDNAPGKSTNGNVISPIETSPNRPPKRRKLDFFNVSPVRPDPAKDANNSNPPEGIDINVLRELPEDVAREVANQYGINLDDVRSKCSTPIKVPETENGNTAVADNPYESIDEIDPTYLSALPASIRNEVLIQFQQVKGKKNVSKCPLTSSPQPCSSRQALEREAKRREESAKQRTNGLDSTTPEANNNRSETNPEVEENDGEAYSTPVFTSSSRSSTSQGRFRSRTDRGTPMSSKRRLNFSAPNANPHAENLTSNQTANLDKPVEQLDMKKFWKDKSYQPETGACRTESSFVPLLNGELKDESVRDILRYEIDSNPNPSSDDKKLFFQYFDALVDRGFIRKTQVLLKFLNRKLKTVPDDNPWHNLIQEILTVVQRHCLKLNDTEIDLDT